MVYCEKYSVELVKKLIKLKRKDINHFVKLRNKIIQIRKNPFHKYKFLHHEMKGINRVHIGHYVLVFVVNHNNKTISFEDYDHHDKFISKQPHYYLSNK